MERINPWAGAETVPRAGALRPPIGSTAIDFSHELLSTMSLKKLTLTVYVIIYTITNLFTYPFLNNFGDVLVTIQEI